MQCMVWALTGWPPTPSTSAAMLAALIHLFPKHNLWIWRWACALNFFGRPWRGLFWVEPVLLNRCLVLTNVLQLSFRVLAIFLQPTPSLCRAVILNPWPVTNQNAAHHAESGPEPRGGVCGPCPPKTSYCAPHIPSSPLLAERYQFRKRKWNR